MQLRSLTRSKLNVQSHQAAYAQLLIPDDKNDLAFSAGMCVNFRISGQVFSQTAPFEKADPTCTWMTRVIACLVDTNPPQLDRTNVERRWALGNLFTGPFSNDIGVGPDDGLHTL